MLLFVLCVGVAVACSSLTVAGACSIASNRSRQRGEWQTRFGWSGGMEGDHGFFGALQEAQRSWAGGNPGCLRRRVVLVVFTSRLFYDVGKMKAASLTKGVYRVVIVSALYAGTRSNIALFERMSLFRARVRVHVVIRLVAHRRCLLFFFRPRRLGDRGREQQEAEARVRCGRASTVGVERGLLG